MTRWPSIEDRLLARIIEGANDCLLFTGPKAGNGYGVIGYQKRQAYVHRVVWELHNGPIKEGYCVLHTCDNPACCNIDHLFLGSHKDNTQDMLRKKRFMPAYKLSLEQVNAIQASVSQGIRHPIIAQQFNVSRSTIQRIARGDGRWRFTI
jgi:HNH endonuclease